MRLNKMFCLAVLFAGSLTHSKEVAPIAISCSSNEFADRRFSFNLGVSLEDCEENLKVLNERHIDGEHILSYSELLVYFAATDATLGGIEKLRETIKARKAISSGKALANATDAYIAQESKFLRDLTTGNQNVDLRKLQDSINRFRSLIDSSNFSSQMLTKSELNQAINEMESLKSHLTSQSGDVDWNQRRFKTLNDQVHWRMARIGQRHIGGVLAKGFSTKPNMLQQMGAGSNWIAALVIAAGFELNETSLARVFWEGYVKNGPITPDLLLRDETGLRLACQYFEKNPDFRTSFLKELNTRGSLTLSGVTQKVLLFKWQ